MTASTAAPMSLDEIVRALRIALRDSPDPAFVLDCDGIVLMANPALFAPLQLDETGVVGSDSTLFTRSMNTEQVLESFRSACDGTPSRYRGTGINKSGEPFVAEVTHLPIRVDGEVVAVLGATVNLTATDRHDAEARQSEDLLRLAGQIGRFGGFSVDAESGRVVLTKEARLLLDIDDDVADATAMAWAMHPDDQRPLVEATLAQCIATGEPFDIECIMILPSGERLPVRTVGEAVVRADGTISGAQGAVWDITDAATARLRERELEARLTLTLAAITDGILFVDDDDRVTYANPQALELARHTEEELFGAPVWGLFPEAVDVGFRDSFARARRSGERDAHRAFFPPFGRWFETTAFPTSHGLAIYLRDVTNDAIARVTATETERKITQQAALLDNANDAMIVRALDGTVEYWNQAAADLYGWSTEEAIGRDVVDLIRSDPNERASATAELMRYGKYAGELHQRTRDDRAIIVDCRWQLITDEDGTTRSVFAVNSDITKYRNEEEARQRAQRLESLGTLAGGIAHDLNNVLTPILMSVQLLKSDETDPERAEMLAMMETAVNRGADMVRQVLSFARGVEGRRIPVDVDRLVTDLVAFSQKVLPSGITLDVDRSTALPATMGDPTQLLQVLVNLVTNARDAMGSSGQLCITAQSIDIADDYGFVSDSVTPGEYVAIAVEDNGPGMPSDVASKIFEPFFTTKAPGKGTGLGLSTSLAIIRSHGGFIQAYSEPERGTRFIVGLPASTESASADPSPPKKSNSMPRGEGELVLVVDDEETIRRVAGRTLRAHGYRTLEATNGREAIEIIEGGTDTVDLVLTDMMMPVMSGAATSAYLEEHHPSIPIIAASGLNSGGTASGSVGMGINRFLAKPYTTSALLTAVHETMREHRGITEESR